MKSASFQKRAFAFAIDIFLFYLAGRIAGFHDVSLVLLWVFYETAYISQLDGSTVGKKRMGLKVVTDARKSVTLSKAFIRAVVKVFSTLLFLAGDLWMLKGKKTKTWHDQRAGTIVIQS